MEDAPASSIFFNKVVYCPRLSVTPENFPEMKPVDHVHDGHREELRASEQRPDKELPVIESRFILYTQNDKGFKGCIEIPEVVPDIPEMEVPFSLLQRFIFPEKRLYPFIVHSRGIDAVDDVLIFLDELFMTHSGDNICREIGVVAGDVLLVN